MSEEKVVILDGTRPGEEDLASVFSILLERIKTSGAEIEVFRLRELKLAYCIGDFGCWLERPAFAGLARQPAGKSCKVLFKAIRPSGSPRMCSAVILPSSSKSWTVSLNCSCHTLAHTMAKCITAHAIPTFHDWWGLEYRRA